MGLKDKMHERMMTFFPFGGHDHDGVNSTPVKLPPGSINMSHLDPSLAEQIGGVPDDNGSDMGGSAVPVPDLVIETPSIGAGGSYTGVVEWVNMCAVRFLRILMTVDTECTITFYHRGTFADEDREFRATNCGNKFLWEGAWIHYDEDSSKNVYFKIQNTGNQASNFQITVKSGTMAANSDIDVVETLHVGGEEFSGSPELVAGQGVTITPDTQMNKITISAGDVEVVHEDVTVSRWALTPIKPTGYSGSVALTSNGGDVNTYMTDGYTHDTNRYVNFGADSQWIQVDVGVIKNIGAVQAIMYFGDGREYKDVSIQVSQDGLNWTTLKSVGAYWSTGEGLWATNPGGILARYVRLNSNGSSANTGNHLVKLIPYALSDKG